MGKLVVGREGELGSHLIRVDGVPGRCATPSASGFQTLQRLELSTREKGENLVEIPFEPGRPSDADESGPGPKGPAGVRLRNSREVGAVLACKGLLGEERRHRMGNLERCPEAVCNKQKGL